MKALEAELRNLSVTREHIDWLRDLLGDAYPPEIAAELSDHLREEEEYHHAQLGEVLTALGERPDLAEPLSQERHHLHLLIDHLSVAAQAQRGRIAPEQRAKLVPHILEEEERHLEAIGQAEKALRGALAGGAASERPRLTVGSLLGVPQVAPRPRR
jgi:hypothetical protein